MKNPDYLIIGKDVSKNARSPLLWNRVFEKLGSASRMGTFDLELNGPSDFQKFIHDRPHLRGLAIGYPNKFHVETQLSGELNYRLGFNVVRIKGNDATGMNFDGVGAVESLLSQISKSKYSLLAEYRFFIFGTGSTARSFQKVLMERGVDPGLVEFISSKREAAGLLQRSKVSHQETVKVQTSRPSIVVNATPLGSKALPDLSPFQINFLQRFEDTLALVFDFNYGVANSGPALAAKSFQVAYLDGFWMNLFQAAHSFDYATFSYLGLRIDEILELMKEPQ